MSWRVVSEAQLPTLLRPHSLSRKGDLNCGHCIFTLSPWGFAESNPSISLLISLYLPLKSSEYSSRHAREHMHYAHPHFTSKHINTVLSGFVCPLLPCNDLFSAESLYLTGPIDHLPCVYWENVTELKPSDQSLACCPNYRQYSLEFSWIFSKKVSIHSPDSPGRCYCDKGTLKLTLYDIDHTCLANLNLEAILDGSEVFGESF